VNAAFQNIRFVYNALARRFHHPYDPPQRTRNNPVLRASGVTAGTLASTGSLYTVVSMDRLLRYFLQQFIRRGAMIYHRERGEI
jgi:hypothetical protein